MEDMFKQTEMRETKQESHIVQNIIGIIFVLIEILLAFRLVFKLLGANPINGFVKGIYSGTQFFVGSFEGIFSRTTTGGLETTAVFEPATLIAMVVIALIAWGVLKLIKPRTSNRFERTEYMEHDNQ